MYIFIEVFESYILFSSKENNLISVLPTPIVCRHDPPFSVRKISSEMFLNHTCVIKLTTISEPGLEYHWLDTLNKFQRNINKNIEVVVVVRSLFKWHVAWYTNRYKSWYMTIHITLAYLPPRLTWLIRHNRVPHTWWQDTTERDNCWIQY